VRPLHQLYCERLLAATMDDLFLDAGPDADKGGKVPRKRLKKGGGGEEAGSNSSPFDAFSFAKPSTQQSKPGKGGKASEPCAKPPSEPAKPPCKPAKPPCKPAKSEPPLVHEQTSQFFGGRQRSVLLAFAYNSPPEGAAPAKPLPRLGSRLAAASDTPVAAPAAAAQEAAAKEEEAVEDEPESSQAPVRSPTDPTTLDAPSPADSAEAMEVDEAAAVVAAEEDPPADATPSPAAPPAGEAGEAGDEFGQCDEQEVEEANEVRVAEEPAAAADWDPNAKVLPPGWTLDKGRRPQDKVFTSPGRTTRLDSWVEVGRHLRGEPTRKSRLGAGAAGGSRARARAPACEVDELRDSLHPGEELGGRRTRGVRRYVEPSDDDDEGSEEGSDGGESEAAAPARRAVSTRACAATSRSAAAGRRKYAEEGSASESEAESSMAAESSGEESGDESGESESDGADSVGSVGGGSEADADASEEWRLSGHKWIGKCARRFFESGASDGVIRKWMPAAPEEGEAALWHMEHDDGDEEDLEEGEVREALRAFRLQLDSAEAAEQAEDGELLSEEGEGEGDGLADPSASRAVEAFVGRRWYAEPGRKPQAQLLVKWRGASYLHVSWEAEGSLLRSDPKMGVRVKAYVREAPPLGPPPQSTAGGEATAAEGGAGADGECAAGAANSAPSDANAEGLPVAGAAAFLDPALLRVEQVLAERDGELLVKWAGLPIAQSSWEDTASLPPHAEALAAFEQARSTPCVPPPAGRATGRPKSMERLEASPAFENGRLLRPYQLEGVNWMLDAWRSRRNVMLADEMGLGKTAQVVATLSQLHHAHGLAGPFLVIAPLSTIGHWRREFAAWTTLRTLVLHGSADDRKVMLKRLWRSAAPAEAAAGRGARSGRKEYWFHAVVTTYETLLLEERAIGAVPWQYLVVDEAHRLKNPKSRMRASIERLAYEQLTLLTGTPVQNSAAELFSLLQLLEPERLAGASEAEGGFGEMREAEEVRRMQALLQPLMLRRVKEDVVGDEIPCKEETIIWVELTGEQKVLYRAILDKNVSLLAQADGAGKGPSMNNIHMNLRKLCNHPRLLQREDAPLPSDPAAAIAALTDASGKMVLLHKLLPKLRAEGRKVLIFSQMTRMLDLIEDYCHVSRFPFERLDGSVAGGKRQACIDRFQNGGSADAFLFLLSTRAGGVGINLTAADTVVLFDSDWNPQNDAQGMARCHRIGQTQQVKVLRLITDKTYERAMFERACLKLSLDHALLGGGGGGGGGGGAREAEPSAAELSDMLRFGAYDVLRDDEESRAATKAFVEADIDQLLSRAQKVTVGGGTAGGAFSKATFASDGVDAAGPAMDDPEFWSKLMPEAAASKPEAALERGARRRKSRASVGDSDDNEDEEDDYVLHGENALDACEAALGGRAGRRVVGEAAGRRVVCFQYKSRRGEGLRVEGVYLDDGRVRLDEAAARRQREEQRRAAAAGGADEEGAGGAEASEEPGNEAEQAGEPHRVVSCTEFARLAKNTAGRTLTAIFLADEPDTCLLDLLEPEAAADRRATKAARAERAASKPEDGGAPRRWSKAERDRALKATLSVGVRHEAEDCRFARGLLRHTLSLLGAAGASKQLRAQVRAAVGEAPLDATFWADWMPQEEEAEEAELWGGLLQDAKFSSFLERNAVTHLTRLVHALALSRVLVSPTPPPAPHATAADATPLESDAPTPPPTPPPTLRLPQEVERGLATGNRSGGSLPARWWAAEHDRALLLRSAVSGMAIGAEDWSALCKLPAFLLPEALLDGEGAAAGTEPLADGAESLPAHLATLSLKQLVARQQTLLKRLAEVLFGSKRSSFFCGPPPKASTDPAPALAAPVADIEMAEAAGGDASATGEMPPADAATQAEEEDAAGAKPAVDTPSAAAVAEKDAAAEPPAAEVPPEGGSVAAPEAKQAPTPAVGTPGDAAGGKRKAEGGSGSVLTKQAKRSGPVTATPAAGLFRFWKK